ncbi:Putative serine/threonine-protein kinase roco7 [Fusarium oxysporum f. sp. cubense race 1]|uniref:Putative serine/threonine-protein kinase roco7 n=1 Tax=Fusarium oxysporum f. sp. cubense (strain race 1) TaxID=1229664 RepID=N4UPJ6_FUSC1|nr:Putative serine/threonine-protein kinase roco7 [Fusarium oxysporum f. sp. cubense race 1]
MSSGFQYNSSFTFSHPGWESDPVADYAELALARVTAEAPDPGPIEDLTTFAQQLHTTGLPICEAADLEDLNDGAAIGSGTTMTVFKCLWKSKNKAVAVKRVNLGIALGQSQHEAHSQKYSGLLKSLLREMRVMNHPWCKAHPNFVELLGISWDAVTSDGYRPAMIVELADPTTPQLRDLVKSSRYPLGLKEQRMMFDLLTDVAEGVTMLHAMKIVHGDLKPDNILLFRTKDRLVAKLSDFGFCSPFTDIEYKIGGTPYWNAPECMPDAPEELRAFRKTITRDLYSFGLVMAYSLFSILPYDEEGEHDADTMTVHDWKLNQDASIFLHEQIIVYVLDFHSTNSTRSGTSIETTSPVFRPKMVSSMGHGLQKRQFGKFDPFRLGQIIDILPQQMVAQSRGFGCPPSAAKAREYETLAAQAGSDAAQVQATFHGLVDGFDCSVTNLVRDFSMHPDTKSDYGDTPIERAAETGSIDCVRLLISLGADIKPLADQELFSSVVITGTRNTIKGSPVSGTASLLSLLCRAVEEVSEDPTSGQTLINGRYMSGNENEGIAPGSPLELAVSVLNYDSVIALLNLGADPNTYNYLPPLQIAVSLREPLLALLLLTHGVLALPNTVSRTDGDTALHCANEVNGTEFAEAPRNEIIPWQQFVKEEVEAIDVDSDESLTARVKACITILLHFGADLEARNSESETALVQAVRMGDYSTAKYLLQMGADIESRDDEGNIALLGIESEQVTQ